MTINPKKTNKTAMSSKLGAKAQRFKDQLEIGFEVMSLEMPFSFDDYGAVSFNDTETGQIGFGLCQLTLRDVEVYQAEETRVICFEDGLHFANGAYFPFCQPPKKNDGFKYREQTPENLAMLVFASIVSNNPIRPACCDDESNHGIKKVEESDLINGTWPDCEN
tara:strand:+ start:297 stop:788 length:492 start_codon:yes stop_codon:yes gene_type:complete